MVGPWVRSGEMELVELTSYIELSGDDRWGSNWLAQDRMSSSAEGSVEVLQKRKYLIRGLKGQLEFRGKNVEDRNWQVISPL